MLGFVCGLLTAPKSGEELRKQLADESEDLYKHASESIHDIKHKTTEAISTLQAKGEDLLKMSSDSTASTKESV